jgi:sulfonate transport system ATP-binding protein
MTSIESIEGEGAETVDEQELHGVDDNLAKETLGHQTDHSIVAEHVVQVFNEGEPNELVALGDLSLEARGGTIIGLVGPSGCGKSTFLRIVAGLDKPTSGTVFYDGEPVTGPDWHRGVVFQGAQLFEFLTVHDNIAFGLKARGVYKQNRDKVDDFIRLVELEGFENTYPHQISGGMAARAAIARTLIQEPGMVLLDEPLSALDAFTRGTIQDEVLRLVKLSNTLALLVTHDIEEAVYLCDRVIVMSPRPGRKVRDIEIDLPHPRERVAPEFVEYRRIILEALNDAESAARR